MLDNLISYIRHKGIVIGGIDKCAILFLFA